ncbi:MAG: HsdM family class I SAM-dependent methyltransferase [Bacillota bacterium]
MVDKNAEPLPPKHGDAAPEVIAALRLGYLNKLSRKWPFLAQRDKEDFLPEKAQEKGVDLLKGRHDKELYDPFTDYETVFTRLYGRADRKKRGVYYTPPSAARYLAERLLHYPPGTPTGRPGLILDPSCGSGVLLSALYLAAARGASAGERRRIKGGVYGYDLDETALRICRYRLALAEMRLCESPEEFYRWLASPESRLIKGNFLHEKPARRFNLIIANPPFVGFRRYGPEEKRYFAQNFASYEGKADLWYYFLEKSVCALEPMGVAGFVLPDYFRRANHGRGLREFLHEKADILEIVEGNGFLSFEGARNHCGLLFLRQKQRKTRESRVLLRVPRDLSAASGNFSDIYILGSYLKPEGWKFVTPEAEKILERINAISLKLKDLAHIANGILTGLDRLASGPGFVFMEQEALAHDLEADLWRKWLKGGDIKRFRTADSGRRLLYATPHLDLARYPKLSAYLREREAALRGRKCGYAQWWALARPKEELPWDRPKLVSPYRAPHNVFAPDFSGKCCSLDVTLVFPESEQDLWYLAGILNSPLLSALFALQSKRMGRLREFYPHSLKMLDIPWKLGPDKRKKIEAAARYLSTEQCGPSWEKVDLELAETVNEACGISQKELECLNALSGYGRP